MKTNGGKKKALIISAISILMSCMVFTGIIFAWYNSTLTNNGNRIKAGSLKIGLYENTAAESQAKNFEDISNGASPLFYLDNLAPGESETKELRVYNLGTLAVKFDVRIIDLTVGGEDGVNIANDIDVYVNGAGAFSLNSFADDEYALLTGEMSEGQPFNSEAQDEGVYADLTIKIDYNKYSEAQGGEVSFNIEVFATQVNNEDYVAPAQPPVRVRAVVNKAAQKTDIVTSVAALSIPKGSIQLPSNNSVVEVSTEIIEKTTEDFNRVKLINGATTIATLDLKLEVDGQPVTVFESPITVSVAIGAGLTIDAIGVVYTGDYSDQGGKPAQPFNITYNQVTGVLTFDTWHFSEFSVKMKGKLFTFENGNTNPDFLFDQRTGTVNANDDKTLSIGVSGSDGPSAPVRNIVGWSAKGVTVATEIYIDPASFATNGVFGVDVTMRSIANAYATERRIAFKKLANGTIQVNPAHAPQGTPIIITEGWYTAGLSYYADDNDKLSCRMFLLDENGNLLAEWIHANLAKVNSPAAPDYDGSFDGIGGVGALWFLGSNASAKLRSVKIYQNS